MSTAPIPDWQRPHDYSRQPTLVFHQPFEAPHRSLTPGRPAKEPARDWAKHAIETLRINRERFASAHSSDSPSRPTPIPAWVYSAGRLSPLAPQSADAWVAVATEMIKDQLAKFELHPDWHTLDCRKGSANFQDLVLERIAAEIRRIAAGP